MVLEMADLQRSDKVVVRLAHKNNSAKAVSRFHRSWDARLSDRPR
jgi:hypothetical protein